MPGITPQQQDHTSTGADGSWISLLPQQGSTQPDTEPTFPHASRPPVHPFHNKMQVVKEHQLVLHKSPIHVAHKL